MSWPRSNPIGPISDHFWPIYHEFHIWPWKFKVNVAANVQFDGHISGLKFNWHVCFLFRGNRPVFGRDIANSIFDLENSRSRSWSRSNPMVIFETYISIDMFAICFVAIGPILSEIYRIPYLTLEINGQGHDDNRPKSNQVIFRSAPSIPAKMKEIWKVVQKLSREQNSAVGGVRTGIPAWLKKTSRMWQNGKLGNVTHKLWLRCNVRLHPNNFLKVVVL